MSKENSQNSRISGATVFFETKLYPTLGKAAEGLLHGIESLRALSYAKPLLRELNVLPQNYVQLAERLLVSERSPAAAALLAITEARLAKKLLRAERSRNRRNLPDTHPISAALARAESAYAEAVEPFSDTQSEPGVVYRNVFAAAGGLAAENKRENWK